MRCHRCGGFYTGQRCRQSHANLDPVITAELPAWRPRRGEWYEVRHLVGLGNYTEIHDSEALILSATTTRARVCVFGPVVFTTEVPLDELYDLPGDDDGD